MKKIIIFALLLVWGSKTNGQTLSIDTIAGYQLCIYSRFTVDSIPANDTLVMKYQWSQSPLMIGALTNSVGTEIVANGTYTDTLSPISVPGTYYVHRFGILKSTGDTIFDGLLIPATAYVTLIWVKPIINFIGPAIPNSFSQTITVNYQINLGNKPSGKVWIYYSSTDSLFSNFTCPYVCWIDTQTVYQNNANYSYVFTGVQPNAKFWVKIIVIAFGSDTTNALECNMSYNQGLWIADHSMNPISTSNSFTASYEVIPFDTINGSTEITLFWKTVSSSLWDSSSQFMVSQPITDTAVFTPTGLLPSTTYDYKCRAKNNSATVWSQVDQITTMPIAVAYDVFPDSAQMTDLDSAMVWFAEIVPSGQNSNTTYALDDFNDSAYVGAQTYFINGTPGYNIRGLKFGGLIDGNVYRVTNWGNCGPTAVLPRTHELIFTFHANTTPVTENTDANLLMGTSEDHLTFTRSEVVEISVTDILGRNQIYRNVNQIPKPKSFSVIRVQTKKGTGTFKVPGW